MFSFLGSGTNFVVGMTCIVAVEGELGGSN